MKRLLNLVLLLALIAGLSTNAFATVWSNPSPLYPGGPMNLQQNVQGLNATGGVNSTGSIKMSGIGTVSAPTLATVGTAGSTSLIYACTALDINGNATVPSATATITTANATLSTTNYVAITCGGNTGAVAYYIHKADTAHIIGMCYTTSGSSCTFLDQNAVGTVGSGGSVSYTYTANTVDQTQTVPSGVQSCSGQVTLVAGTLEVTAPCVSTLSSCSASYAGAGTPVAGDFVSCSPTSTATIVGGATVTVGAVQLQAAGTPSPSVKANWWAGPQ